MSFKMLQRAAKTMPLLNYWQAWRMMVSAEPQLGRFPSPSHFLDPGATTVTAMRRRRGRSWTRKRLNSAWSCHSDGTTSLLKTPPQQGKFVFVMCEWKILLCWIIIYVRLKAVTSISTLYHKQGTFKWFCLLTIPNKDLSERWSSSIELLESSCNICKMFVLFVKCLKSKDLRFSESFPFWNSEDL